VACDVAAARRFVDQAQSQFIDFSEHAYRISAQLADRTQSRNNEDKHMLDSIFEQVTLIGSIGILGIFLLSLFFARLISSRIIAIANGLSALSASAGMPPHLPEIEQMHGAPANSRIWQAPCWISATSSASAPRQKKICATAKNAHSSH
jgi:hypothetical protein